MDASLAISVYVLLVRLDVHLATVFRHVATLHVEGAADDWGRLFRALAFLPSLLWLLLVNRLVML